MAIVEQCHQQKRNELRDIHKSGLREVSMATEQEAM